MQGLLIAAMLVGPTSEPLTVVVVDSIEVNEIMDQSGNQVFRQVWYLEWDWQVENGTVSPIPVSRGWRRCRCGEDPVVTELGAVDTFEESGHWYQVVAPSIAYTTTTADPETRCREVGAYRPICP